MGRPRPWLAALLAVAYPGLGHVYLREWARALLWFVLGVGTVAIALPEDVYADASITDPGSILAASEAMVAEASTYGLVTIVLVFAFSMADAYVIARGTARARARAEAEPGDPEHQITCPACGRPVDAELDFCHWCTTEFDEVGATKPAGDR